MDNQVQENKIGKVRWFFFAFGSILIVLGGWYLWDIGASDKGGLGSVGAFMATPVAFLILAFGFSAIFPVIRRLLGTRNRQAITLLVVVVLLLIVFFLGFPDQMKELIGAWKVGSH